VAGSDPGSPSEPDDFSGAQLLLRLGSPLPASMLKTLQHAEDLSYIPNAMLEIGGKSYIVEGDSGEDPLIFVGGDNVLLAVLLSSDDHKTSSRGQGHLLKGFVLSERLVVTVLNTETFEPMEMQVQKYVSKVSPTIHAIVFMQGESHTLGFFDSTRIEMKKLLPASPDTIDPAALKEIRSLLKSRSKLRHSCRPMSHHLSFTTTNSGPECGNSRLQARCRRRFAPGL
jgi:hypothetical protein